MGTIFGMARGVKGAPGIKRPPGLADDVLGVADDLIDDAAGLVDDLMDKPAGVVDDLLDDAAGLVDDLMDKPAGVVDDLLDDAAGLVDDLVDDLIGAVDEGVSGAGNTGKVLEYANYAQKTFSHKFSAVGSKIYSELAGEPINTIDDLVHAIQSGKVKVSDLPIDYIVRDGNTLILNTRTAQALTQAGIPRAQWIAANKTGNQMFEELLTGQLNRNGLQSSGIESVRPSGGK